MWRALLPALLLIAPAAQAHPITGAASWYGIAHDGRTMANGKPFRARALSAASRTIPLGTLIRVINRDNGKTITLRVTDRGPYVAGRVLDVSEAAAQRLGFHRRGLARVRIEPLSVYGR